MRILVIEDDPALAALLVKGLVEEGFEVVRESDFTGGHERARSHPFDIIVLDALLPGGSGIDLCRRLRQRGIDTPILILTPGDAMDSGVEALEVGADDYVAKPLVFREIIARVRALLRRRPTAQPEVVVVGDLTVDLRSRRVERAGEPIVLTAKEFALLELFLRHRDEVVDRTTICTYVWHDTHDPLANVLETLVSRLRRKIDDGFNQRLIHTLRGAGYRFGL